MVVINDDDLASWSCEIGVVPRYMIPDGGDEPFRNVVTECWDRLFPNVPCDISSGWGKVTAALPLIKGQANLGYATTEELFRELLARFTNYYSRNDIGQMAMTDKIIILAEMLGGLDAQSKEYRTIDIDD